MSATPHENEPKTLAEALSRPEPEAHMWYQAALDEMQALTENGVFELVQLPANRKAIGSRWVFKVKRNSDGLKLSHQPQNGQPSVQSLPLQLYKILS